MDFSRFFIDRPIFAAVLSILIFITGLIAIPLLPVSEYPDVVPPSVQVRAEYPGANPKVIAETVATPLEEAINGVENMMYMKSVAGSDGVLVTTVTFRPGTDPDQAQVQVQNRVAQAEARLPEDVRRLGITTQKQSPTLTLVVHLFSPNGKYDSLYMRNYATLKVKDELARLPGVGQIQIFGSGEYAMRVWLDPNKVAARGLTASDVVTAMQEQNVQVSAGQLGAEPLPQESDFLISINAQGRLHTEEEFGNIILKTAQDGSLVRLRDVARIEMGSGSYALRSQLNNKDAVGIGIFQSPGANAIDLSNAVRAKMAELATRFPEDMQWAAPYDPTVFVRDSIRAVVQTLLEAVVLVVLVVILFLQTWRASIIPLIAVPVSVVGTFSILYLLGFSLNTLSLFGLVLAIGIVVDDAQSTISEESFQTLLVSRALEKLGYTVEKPSEVDYNVAYTSIAAGDTTFIATNWQPLHDDMYAAAGGDNKFYRKGVYVSGAAQGYLIDKKTAEQYHITSIDQLKDPQIAKLFDTNNDGKADLTGCTPGWGCEAVINHQIDAYGLSKTVTHNQGNYAAMMADTIARYKEGKPVLYYTWTPYWVSDVLKPGKDVVWLQVPFSSLPGEQKNIDTKLANGANYGFPVNTMHIVANKAWAEKNPAAATLFSVMKLPIADINAENAMMHEGHASEADINGHVDGWIKAHQPLFDSWVKTALAAQQ